MAKLTKERSALLDKLISHCITYGLNYKESMEYISKEFGEIKERVFYRRKNKLSCDETAMRYLDGFAKVGFVQQHVRIFEALTLQLDDTLHRYWEERQKLPEFRNEEFMLKLKKETRECCHYLEQHSLGTPTMAAIKLKIDKLGGGGAATHGLDFYYNHFANNS